MLIWPRILWRLLGVWQSFWQWRERVAQRKAGADAERLKIGEAENEASNRVADIDAERLKRTVVDRMRDGSF